MAIPNHHVVAAAGLAVTGLLALADQYDAVPAALIASSGAWWILRDARVVRSEGGEEDYLAPDDVAASGGLRDRQGPAA